ncbi:MAG: DUF5694 domain-containing protein [Bacteroidota bacterium]
MKKYWSLSIILFCSFISYAQENYELKKPSSFFPKEKTKVLVLGTFHFDYPGLDAVKSKDENKIDVLEEPKKSEVTELVKYLKKFNPTKIAIEAHDHWNSNEKFRKYKNGELRNKRDERYQLGMRIATELEHDTIYNIDAKSFNKDLMKLDSSYFQELFKDYDFKNEDRYMQMFYDMIEYEDSLPSKLHLIDFFKYINSKEYHNLGYGAYLVGDFKLDNNRGADVLSIWWYNRNLRIFRNIQKINATSDDRILVIIGNGHASILRNLIESSPEYEFVEFNSVN